jgi:hypothetical protein
MVRKQIYIQKRQDVLLKRLSQARGQSEAEIIRHAIDREVTGDPAQFAQPDRSAWQELIAFLDARRQAATGGKPYHWNREEIYAERANRWLRDRKKD